MLLCGPGAAQGADDPAVAGLDDEAFIATLEAAGLDDPVDRTRLSRLFFGIAATLGGGRSGVRLLQSAPNARLLTTESARNLAADRYRAYAEAVERFRNGAARLLDWPHSSAGLHEVLVGGHRACWRLDQYTTLMRSYGLRGSDMVTILSSTEACARFRRAAFQDCVERLVARDLSEADDLRRELRDVTVELEELERLLEDLRRIDAAQ
jgi:hypothetical protein